MIVAPHHAFGFVRIDVRVVEKAHLEFPKEHRSDEFVELRFLEHAPADEFSQMQVALRFRQLDIDAGLNGQSARFLLVFGH